MSVVAIGSAKGSPGATNLSVGLGLLWKSVTGRRAVLVEADGDGGVIAARFGLDNSPSLVEFADVANQGVTAEQLYAHCQLLAGQLPVLVAPGSGEATGLVLGPIAGRVGDDLSLLDEVELDVIVDVGRVRAESLAAALIKYCDLYVLVTQPRFDQLVPLVHHTRSAAVRELPAALVCIGDRPYPPAEMAKATRLDLLGVMAHEPRVTRILGQGLPKNPRYRRLLLWRTMTELAGRIHSRLQVVDSGLSTLPSWFTSR